MSFTLCPNNPDSEHNFISIDKDYKAIVVCTRCGESRMVDPNEPSPFAISRIPPKYTMTFLREGGGTKESA